MTRTRPVGCPSPSPRCRHRSRSVPSARTSGATRSGGARATSSSPTAPRWPDRAARESSKWRGPSDVADFAHVLNVVIPAAFVPAETAQETNGASNGRFESVFDETAPAPGPARPVRAPVWSSPTTRGGSRRVRRVGGAGRQGDRDRRECAGDRLRRCRRAAPAGRATRATLTGWWCSAPGRAERCRTPVGNRCSTSTQGSSTPSGATSAWVRAVSDHAGESDRPMRIVTVIDATTSGGRSRAQAAAQLARGAPRHRHPDRRLRDRRRDRRGLRYASVSELAGYLVGADDTGALSGAELVDAPPSGSDCAAIHTLTRPSPSAGRNCRRGSTTRCATIVPNTNTAIDTGSRA